MVEDSGYVDLFVGRVAEQVAGFDPALLHLASRHPSFKPELSILVHRLSSPGQLEHMAVVLSSCYRTTVELDGRSVQKLVEQVRHRYSKLKILEYKMMYQIRPVLGVVTVNLIAVSPRQLGFEGEVSFPGFWTVARRLGLKSVPQEAGLHALAHGQLDPLGDAFTVTGSESELTGTGYGQLVHQRRGNQLWLTALALNKRLKPDCQILMEQSQTS